jgi:hypothetical protein
MYGSNFVVSVLASGYYSCDHCMRVRSKDSEVIECSFSVSSSSFGSLQRTKSYGTIVDKVLVLAVSFALSEEA